MCLCLHFWLQSLYIKICKRNRFLFIYLFLFYGKTCRTSRESNIYFPHIFRRPFTPVFLHSWDEICLFDYCHKMFLSQLIVYVVCSFSCCFEVCFSASISHNDCAPGPWVYSCPAWIMVICICPCNFDTKDNDCLKQQIKAVVSLEKMPNKDTYADFVGYDGLSAIISMGSPPKGTLHLTFLSFKSMQRVRETMVNLVCLQEFS